MPSNRIPSFSTTRRDAAFLGMMFTSMRCRSDRLERVLQEHDHRLGHQALAGDRLVDPVADEGRLQRSALDRRQRDLADEATLIEDAESKARPHLAFAFANRASTDETLLVVGQMGRVRRPGLPLEEPFATARTHLVPRVVVLFGHRAQDDAPSVQRYG